MNLDQLFDPSTFVGSVLAAAVGVGVVWIASYASRSVHGWWLRITQFELWPYSAPSTVDSIWDEGETLRDGRPITKKTDRGEIDITLASNKDWVGGPMDISFVRRRVSWLPGWVPLNIRSERPRISCRGIDIDPQMGGNYSFGSTGYLNERAGAYRTSMMLSESAFVPAGHEILVTVKYEARLAFSGLVAVRVRIDGRWLSAYYPVSVTVSKSAAEVGV